MARRGSMSKFKSGHNETTPGLDGPYRVKWLGNGKGFDMIDRDTDAKIGHFDDIHTALNTCIRRNLGVS